MAVINFIPHDTKIDFIQKRVFTYIIAGLMVIASLVGILAKGVNFGIDFKGGYILEIRTNDTPDLAKMRQTLKDLNIGDVAIQTIGSENNLMIKIERQEGDEAEQTQAIETVKKALGKGIEYRKIDTVGPKVGKELVSNSLKAVIFSLIAIFIYVTVRFEWPFALSAILALAHDCLIIFGLYALFPMEFNETAIIVILITAGYSINDTIVIFDRVRENIKRYKKYTLAQILNKSINDTLGRTILTSGTTMLALLALYFFGGRVIASFSLPIMVGILIGTFSSIFLASPLLILLGYVPNKEDKKPSDNEEGFHKTL